MKRAQFFRFLKNGTHFFLISQKSGTFVLDFSKNEAHTRIRTGDPRKPEILKSLLKQIFVKKSTSPIKHMTST